MGPSGSGKTTLLDVLAGRKTVGTVEGSILFSAQKPSLNFLRRFTGYVEQLNTLIGILSVREMLMYTAELKLPIKVPLSEKERIVDYYIERLGLVSCKDTRIGNSLNRGISGGQAKRTNIALSMVVHPKVVFLDEPTSGLDSYTANEVMSVVKGLVSTGVTICATIHSPSPYTFSLFDRLLVLVRGKVVYFGHNGGTMVDYFKDCGVTPPKSALHEDLTQVGNHADYLTDLVVGAEREGRAHEYAAAYEKSSVKTDMEAIIARGAQVDTMRLTESERADLSVNRATVTPLWKGMLTMLKYRTSRNYCDPEFLGPRVGDKLIFSVLVATLYPGVGDDYSSDNLYNTASVLFMWCTLPAFGAAAYVPALSLEKALFVRERSDGLYRPITYLLSKFVDEILITFVASLIFSAFVFYVVELQGSFVLFWLTYLVTLACGISLAYFVAVVSPNMDIANTALPTYVVTLLFFSGLLLRFDDMPKYWQWYAYINFLRYSFGAQMINHFEGKTYNDVPASVEGVPILEFYSFDHYTSWELLGYVGLFSVAFFGLAWFALQFMRMSKR